MAAASPNAPSATTEPAQPPPSAPQPSSPTPTPTPTGQSTMAHDFSDAEDVQSFDLPDSDLPPLPTEDDDSFLQRDALGSNHDESALVDREMKRQLMDMESSFLPEASVHGDATQGAAGADDTFVFGGTQSTQRHSPSLDRVDEDAKEGTNADAEQDTHQEDSSMFSNEPPTPADAYKTPAARRADVGADDSLDADQSTSETAPSSPSAQAAQRNRTRLVSEDSDAEDATEHSETDAEQSHAGVAHTGGGESLRPTSSASTVKAPEFTAYEENSSSLAEDQELSMENVTVPGPPAPATAGRVSKRPSFLQNRHSSQRSSVSSFTNHSEASGDVGSIASLGADYALQSGGAAPRSSGQNNRNSFGLSRLPSLGSIASSVSGYSDSNPAWDKNRSTSANSLSGYLHPPDGNLERLEEEVPNSTTPPETPRAPGAKPHAPTDTVITRHVQDIQVPDTVAREFRAKHSRSPDKRHMATPFTKNKHTLTLKEQNSKIDKLSKENFDLKLKIHFLDQALQNRSDEGVKDMISKNVQLQTDLATEKKENNSLRKKIRDLERRLKAQEDGLAAAKGTTSGSEDERSDQSSRQAEMEEEIQFLRERLESSDTVIEQWKQEVLQKEADNRRMADYIKGMREKGTSEGSASLWKEDLEDERARREQAEARCEQAEAEAQKLREEMQRMKESNQQSQHHLTTNNFKHVHNNTRRIHTSYLARSNSGSDANELPTQQSLGDTSGTYVDTLKTDNETLQRDLHAQASMLTSKHRENLRLREENEGLKLAIRRGDVSSVAGDSILERSISRNHQRSVSRASGGTHETRRTQMSDAERDDFESKYAALRDELSQAKLQYKELDDQLNGHLDLLEQAEGRVQELEKELQNSTEDLQQLSSERDEILGMMQDKETECEDMRQEATETVQRLESEIEQKEQECNRLVTDLENTNEDFNALQQEMKAVSESLVQLEDDRDASLRKIQNLESELHDANQELDRQDKTLSDERSKNERLEIQVESCQNEIDFLREEQESDKIKIGELESAHNTAQITIQDEKERYRDLEERLAEERRQRDILETQEKQEVEKVITELNGQLTKLKEDNRKLRKNLSGKEVEATTWKQRLDELESNLREALGNLNGTRSSLLKDINKLQRDLDANMQELENTKSDLAEKDRLLRNRDALLESTGMESRRLSDMLERERQARRQDQAAFENVKRGHQSVTRTIQQHETRVLELETVHSQDRQKIQNLERQYREQLLERNNLLFALWNRLSTLCGPEWSRNHALVNGEVPSMELISKNLPGFNKNIILAVKTVEQVVGGFKQRVRSMEKDLLRDYQTLEHTLDVRVKRLEQLEKIVMAQKQSIGRPSTIRGGMVDLNTSELNKLRNDNKTLRTEVQTLRAITSTTQAVTESLSRSSSRAGSPNASKRASMAQTLLRHQSASAVESMRNQQPDHPYPQAEPLQPGEQKWIHRLKELEKRLKAEREARLLDRSGARKRLEQKVEENADLRALLERERGRKGDESSMSRSVSGNRSGRGSATGSARAEEEMY